MMDGMTLARRRMSTQYKVCGVCLVIGWVELPIEERETEDDRDLMEDVT